MFEMRWLNRHVPIVDVPDGFYEKVKVLQYREKIQSDEESAWPTTVWTEWKDVPIVEEGE